jgi:hypothetical protein
MKAMFVATMVLVSSAAAVAWADYPDYSEWSTSYSTAEGYAVQSHVILRGDRGSYHTDQGAYGWLYNIEYRPAENQPEGVTLVTGSWKFQSGQTGWFKFHVNRPFTRYSGIWGFTGSRTAYAWNGRRAADLGAEPLVTNPPINPAPSRPFITQTPSVTPSPVFTPPPLRPSFPSGGGRPSGGPPTIGDASQLPAGTQLQFDQRTGTMRAFDSNGRFLGNVRRRGN